MNYKLHIHNQNYFILNPTNNHFSDNSVDVSLVRAV
jgi:hypothetical protein